MINRNGGDRSSGCPHIFLNRFFDFLLPLSPNVAFVHRKYWKEGAILKKFPSLIKVKRQRLLTDHLVNHHFPTYHVLHDRDTFFTCNDDYFVLLKYIPRSVVPFSYRNRMDIAGALRLLQTYHRLSASLVKKHVFPAYNLSEQWERRLAVFLSNLPTTLKWLPPDLVNEYIRWAESSLSMMKKRKDPISGGRETIIHGDVAHHNFLRGRDKRIYLIDFDRASLSWEAVDYVQFAQRILPFFRWDVRAVFQFDELSRYASDPWFLSALLFPAEPFREWNRMMGNCPDVSKTRLWKGVTAFWNEYEYRKKMSFHIGNMV